MGKWTLDPGALRHVVPQLSERDATRIADGLAAAFRRYEITTPRRAAMAVAQWAHESAGFSTGEEFASGDAYEGRRDLGNTVRGDGRRFKGRGRIMITGRSNYTAVAKAFGIDCVNHPEILARSPYSELASAWWWHSHDCNGFCDSNDFIGLTRRINGGLNGLEDRQRYYARARQVAERLVPRDRWAVLTPAERERMETLAAERRVARRHGGWGKVDPSHRARAGEAKRWLAARRKQIWHKARDEPDGWEKGRRRARYRLLRAATMPRRRAQGPSTPAPGPGRPKRPHREAMKTEQIQRALRTCGWPVAIDGEAGPEVFRAIKDFQRGFAFWKLLVDGHPGAKTIEALRHAVEADGRCSEHFHFKEFASKGDGWIKVNRELVLGLEEYRALIGRPLSLVSAYRDPRHNQVVGGAKSSQHLHGNGVDIPAVMSAAAVRRLRRFSGIGIQRGTGLVRHVDVRHVGPNTTGGTAHDPTIWFYGS
jgi:predicted chitinase